MSYILSRLIRFSPYSLFPFIGVTLPYRVTIGQIALVGFLFSFVITPMPIKKLEARSRNYRDSFLIHLNWVKATTEFSICNPTWIFLIIFCLISGLYVLLTMARTLYIGRGEEVV